MAAFSADRVADPVEHERTTAGAPTAELLGLATDAYRAAHVLADGPFPQVQGILADDVAAAVADPRTILAPLPGVGVEVPVLTPIDLVSWYGADYRLARFGLDTIAATPMWHLSTFPALSDADHAELVGTATAELHRRHPGGSIVFADHADRGDDPSGRRLGPVLAAAPGGFVELDVTDHGPAREHYFAGKGSSWPVPAEPEHDVLRTRVTGPRRDEAFVDELWAIYEEPFRELSARTPLRTYFGRDELADAIGSPGVIQSEYRVDGRLVSWIMLSNHVSSFPWMDAEAFRAYAPEFSAEDTWVFPGVVTDQDFRGNHCADRLIEAVSYRMASASTRHLIVFETVDDNVGFLPDLISAAVEATGFATVRFDEIGAQVHRMWSSAS